MLMNVRALALATALVLSPFSTQAQASEANLAELEDSRAIVQAVVPASERTANLQRVMKVIGSQMMQAGLFDTNDPGMSRLFDDFMAYLPEQLSPMIDGFGDDMAHAMAQAYVREFSANELKQIRKFAETPAGKHYLGASMKMLEDPAVAAANQRFLASLQTEFDPIMIEWDRRIRQYRAARPEQERGQAALPVTADYPPPAPPAPPTPPR
ncbi:DUF2059 domain-containing protein [Altererythrobacter sp. Z27]|uniref:DUF2059 domain-containing protein n=1 Tax=Altererythrobacter sp. Z27 TaxID=3461147 RepID=UPI0040442ECF